MSSHGVARTARHRTEKQRDEAIKDIRAYRSLENQIRSKLSHSAADQQFDRNTFELSTQLLQRNPEYYTIWNVRRRCLALTILSTSSESEGNGSWTTSCSINWSDDGCILQHELDFITALIKEHPKCYWIWKYRLWILNQATARLPIEAARSVWENELALISKILHRDRRNFHAWGFRRHAIAQLESAALKGKSMVESEFEYTTKSIRLDLSNFSAWHNRSQLIPRLLRERKSGNEARKIFLEAELDVVRDALNVGPDDQSLWYYHKYLIFNLVGLNNDQTIAPQLSVADRKLYLLTEIGNIRELAEDYAGIKWIWEALVDYTITVTELEDKPMKTQERTDLVYWLEMLRILDRKRIGRWNYLETRFGI